VYPPLYCSLYGPAYVVRWNKLAQWHNNIRIFWLADNQGKLFMLGPSCTDSCS
jgi:hypothetical protein